MIQNGTIVRVKESSILSSFYKNVDLKVIVGVDKSYLLRVLKDIIANNGQVYYKCGQTIWLFSDDVEEISKEVINSIFEGF